MEVLWRPELRRIQGCHEPYMVHGGESGIRTHGLAFGGTHDFQSCPFSQLGHLSDISLRVGYVLFSLGRRFTQIHTEKA